MMAATMDVCGPSHVMDVVAMSMLNMNRMLHRQADSFYDGRSCCGFSRGVVVCHQFSRRTAVLFVRFIHGDVEAGLFEFFLDIKFATGLKLP